MKTESLKTCCGRGLLLVAAMLLLPSLTRAHVVAPEQFHPVVESYRRGMFLLNLNPVQWAEVKNDAERIANGVPAATPHAPATMTTAIVDVTLRVTMKVSTAAPKAK